MLINIACPSCDEVYEDQDESVLGTDVECECGHVFVATATPPSRPKTPQKQSRPTQSKSATPQPREPRSASGPKGTSRSEPSNKSSVSSGVWLVVTVVVGAATAFGAMYALGFLPTAADKPPDETVDRKSHAIKSAASQKLAINDAKSSTKSVSVDPAKPNPAKTTISSETPPNKPDLGKPLQEDPSAIAKTETPEPRTPKVIKVAPPEVPSGSSNEPIARGYQLLEVAPFDASNPITAQLQSVVSAEIQAILAARKSLVKVMDAQVIALATAGKVDDIQKLRAAKEKVEHGDISLVSELENDAIATAISEYKVAITAPQGRLIAEYGAAIGKAREEDNVELLTNLTRERDAGFELTAQTWIVVFRSADPSHWNSSYSNGNDLAVSISSIPDSVRSLRLRRMDNGAAVVIPMSKAWLTDEHTDESTKVGWIAKNSDYWKSRRLGIFRTNKQLRDAPSGTVLVSSGSFSRGYAGWGFGHTDNRSNLPQGFTWNGVSLGPTVFEIAVSNVAVESITPFSLRVDSPAASKRGTELPTDDPAVAQLEAAKDEHKQSIESARLKVIQALDDMLKELGMKGDARGIEKLAATRKEFMEHDVIRGASSSLRSKLASFQSEIHRADQNLLKAYTRALATFKRDENDGLVSLLSNQIEEGVGYEAERWMVLFSSPNPSLWNTRSRGQYKFARPATDAANDIKYLRMRVISAKGSDKKTPPVICEMTKERLVQQSHINGVGWNGLKTEGRNAVHLGIYLLDKVVEFPAPRNTHGLVSIWDKGFDGHLGWGFGHHIRIDKVQGFSWGGQTSPQPLLIEIAVSSQPLRDNEWKVLQGGTGQLAP